MVLSMTGYGRAEQERSGRDITVEKIGRASCRERV